MQITYTKEQIEWGKPFNKADVCRYARVDDLSIEATELERMAVAAAMEIEAYCGLVLLAHNVVVTVREFGGGELSLPVGPLWKEGMNEHPVTVQIDGEPYEGEWSIQGERYPSIVFLGSENLYGSKVSIEYPAGYGKHSGDIPADLAHAIADHASALYDIRGGLGQTGNVRQGLSLAAARIASRYKRVSVGLTHG